MNKQNAINALNKSFKSSQSYNEAVISFFEQYICAWLNINPSCLPSEPQKAVWQNEDGSQRVLPKQNLLTEALIK